MREIWLEEKCVSERKLRPVSLSNPNNIIIRSSHIEDRCLVKDEDVFYMNKANELVLYHCSI